MALGLRPASSRPRNSQTARCGLLGTLRTQARPRPPTREPLAALAENCYMLLASDPGLILQAKRLPSAALYSISIRIRMRAYVEAWPSGPGHCQPLTLRSRWFEAPNQPAYGAGRGATVPVTQYIMHMRNSAAGCLL